MRHIESRLIAKLMFAAVAGSAVLAAFLRGDHLLGVICGVVYAAIALSLVWLLTRCKTPAGRISIAQASFVAMLALPVGYVIAFPTSISPDLQRFIDMQATDRQVLAELAAVFVSDPAYRNVAVSSDRLKIVNITIRGSLGSQADLDRLRSRVNRECPTLSECFLHWDVSLRDTDIRMIGSDKELFQEPEPIPTTARAT